MSSPVIDLSRREIHGIDPRDGSPLDPVPADAPESVAGVVAACRRGQESWAALSPKDRAQVLAQARRRFLEQADALVSLLGRENGKPPGEAYTSEIVSNIALFDYWLAEAPKLLAPRPVKLSPLEYPKKRAVTTLEPRGVVGLIAPWNYPVSIPLRTLLPALLAGNGVVFKPSEYAPRIGRAVADLFADLLPDGTLSLVQGGGEVGSALVDAVDHVVFTGSVGTGRKVASRAAQRLISTSLELGGKDAAIVLEDADIERAAQGVAWGAFTNAGQNCSSVERVYVVRSIADTFIKRVTEIANSLRVGHDLGPLTQPIQRAIVEAQLVEARVAGANFRTGGGRAPGPGLYLQPTVLVLPQSDTLMIERDETFGPVLPVRVVEDEAEAVRRANDSRYGLTASVWTRDLARGERVAGRLRVGTVTVNNHSFTAALPAAPWSGVGESGTGTTNSPRAFEEMCRPKFTLVDASSDARELWWYPYNETLVEISQALVQRAKGGFSTLLGMGKALARLPKRFSDS
jgi:acyl-CoA reductase-like NAD-dependent aldehyde dehydrogenase